MPMSTEKCRKKRHASHGEDPTARRRRLGGHLSHCPSTLSSAFSSGAAASLASSEVGFCGRRLSGRRLYYSRCGFGRSSWWRCCFCSAQLLGPFVHKAAVDVLPNSERWIVSSVRQSWHRPARSPSCLCRWLTRGWTKQSLMR